MPTALQALSVPSCDPSSAGFYHRLGKIRSPHPGGIGPRQQGRLSVTGPGVPGHGTTSSGSSDVLPAARRNPSALPRTPQAFTNVVCCKPCAKELYSESEEVPACRGDRYSTATACPVPCPLLCMPPSARSVGTSRGAPPATQHSACSRSSPGLAPWSPRRSFLTKARLRAGHQ